MVTLSTETALPWKYFSPTLFLAFIYGIEYTCRGNNSVKNILPLLSIVGVLSKGILCSQERKLFPFIVHLLVGALETLKQTGNHGSCLPVKLVEKSTQHAHFSLIKASVPSVTTRNTSINSQKGSK